jgi:flagellar protein FliO/FliZ
MARSALRPYAKVVMGLPLITEEGLRARRTAGLCSSPTSPPDAQRRRRVADDAIVVVTSRPGPIARRRLRASFSAPLLAPLLAVLALLLFAAPAVAAEAPKKAEKPAFTVDTTPLPDSVTGGSKPPASGRSATSTSGAIAKMVVGLGIVLVVIYGVYWLLKSTGRSKRKGVTADGRMTVVGTTVLSPGKSLHLVRVGDDIVLVGAAEHGVTRVHAWTGEDADRLEAALVTPIDGLADGGAGAKLMDELRRRTVRQ